MNPYDFVPFPAHIERHAPADHDVLTGHSGHVTCTLTARTPFIILDTYKRPDHKTGAIGTFMENAEGQFFIPGSSLKGMIRSIFEVLMPSCVAIKSNKHNLTSHAVAACSQRSALCPACRTFGFLKGGAIHKGAIHFSDAVASASIQTLPPLQLVPLSSPRPTHTAFYKPSGQPAGRKFYFHHHQPSRAQSQNEKERGPSVQPLAPGAHFTFRVAYENLSQEEEQGLVAALTLSPSAPHQGERVEVCHKLGYGKPAGLGSISIRVDRVQRSPVIAARYRRFEQEPDTLEGKALGSWVTSCQARFFESPSEATQQLIRILRFPPDPNQSYQYPSREWFDDHAQAPLSATP